LQVFYLPLELTNIFSAIKSEHFIEEVNLKAE